MKMREYHRVQIITVKAVQVRKKNLPEVVKLFHDLGVSARLTRAANGSSLIIAQIHLGGPTYFGVGDWLVEFSDGEMRVCSDTEFAKLYRVKRK